MDALDRYMFKINRDLFRGREKMPIFAAAVKNFFLASPDNQ